MYRAFLYPKGSNAIIFEKDHVLDLYELKVGIYPIISGHYLEDVKRNIKALRDHLDNILMEIESVEQNGDS